MGTIDVETSGNQRDITSYRVIAKFVHKLCLGRVNPELRQKNPGPKDGTDR